MTLDNNKISILKEIFWKMNEITSSTEEVTDKDNKKKIVLHINVNGKDALEMAQKYNFSIEQNKQLAELLDKQYSSLWLSVIYGSSVGNTDIVEVAKNKLEILEDNPSGLGMVIIQEWNGVRALFLGVQMNVAI